MSAYKPKPSHDEIQNFHLCSVSSGFFSNCATISLIVPSRTDSCLTASRMSRSAINATHPISTTYSLGFSSISHNGGAMQRARFAGVMFVRVTFARQFINSRNTRERRRENTSFNCSATAFKYVPSKLLGTATCLLTYDLVAVPEQACRVLFAFLA